MDDLMSTTQVIENDAPVVAAVATVRVSTTTAESKATPRPAPTHQFDTIGGADRALVEAVGGADLMFFDLFAGPDALAMSTMGAADRAASEAVGGLDTTSFDVMGARASAR